MWVIIFLGLLAVALGGRANTTEMFHILDINKDGLIRLTEMMEVYSGYDTNGDGLMNYKEFVAGLHPGSPPLELQEDFKLFDKVDKEKNNILDPSVVVIFFDSIDVNNNGEIPLAEFEENYYRLFVDDDDEDD